MYPKHFVLSALVGALAALAPAAYAQDSCNAHFTRSTAISSLVVEAFDVMHAKKATDYPTLLPRLEKELNALSAAEIKAEACDGNHVNAYTVKQFTELTALKARGLPTGFPADLTIVKQPDLNQASLAYAVGWIKYEQGDFAGALAAYSKGIGMFPHETSLQQEYIATLVQLKRYKDAVNYAEATLADGTTMDDATRGKTYRALAVAHLLLGNLQDADSMIGVALKYANTTEVQDVQKQIRNAIADKN